MRSPISLRHLGTFPTGLSMLFLCGCAAEFYFDSSPRVRGPFDLAERPSAEAARRLPMFTGEGAAVGWKDLMDAMAWADVVILGEQHDDAIGHAVQLAVVQDAVARWPQTVVSMEMLERDEQPLVDDYFDGIIDAKRFARLTFSDDWAGEGSWKAWYQPVIDAARDGGGRVVAANAPRRYVKLARREGYARLDMLPPDRRRWVTHPPALPEGRYRKRFWEVMSPPMPPEGMPKTMPQTRPSGEDTTSAEPHASKMKAASDKQPEEPDAPKQPRMPFHPLSDEDIEAIFRSQLVWDATMAQSIARATDRGARKVIHLVGQFHCDFEGGTVLELRRRLPGVRILVVSMQRAWPDALRDEDRGRADIVIYTGERPMQENGAVEPPATSDSNRSDEVLRPDR